MSQETQILNDYAEKKKLAKQLAEELKEMHPAVEKLMKEMPEEKFTSEFGSLGFRATKKYTYTEAVTKLEEEAQPFVEKAEKAKEVAQEYTDKVKAKQKEEVLNCVAEVEGETKTLVYKP